MNLLKIYKNGNIVPTSIGCLYCKKRLNVNMRALNKGCLLFLRTLKNNSWEECPSGYSAIKQSKHCLCGCFISDKNFDKRKKNRASRMNAKEVDIISKLDSDKISKLLELDVFVDSYSSFIHDFSHSIGFLKTHLDSCNSYKEQIDSLPPIFDCYDRIIGLFENYNNNYVSRPKLDDWMNNRENLDNVLNNYERKRNSYISLINGIQPLTNKMGTMIETAFEDIKNNCELNDQEKNKLYSMLYMKDLFVCQLEYATKSYLINYGIDKVLLSPPKKVDVYKTIQKLVYLLKTPAKSKDLEGVFISGKSRLHPLVTEDVYLGFFILLENSLKYACQKTKIEVKVNDISNDLCRVVITNSSDYVSKESLQRLTELGFRGENSKNKESHGMGLAIAKVIFEQSNTSISFDYDGHSFSTIINFTSTSRT